MKAISTCKIRFDSLWPPPDLESIKPCCADPCTWGSAPHQKIKILWEPLKATRRILLGGAVAFIELEACGICARWERTSGYHHKLSSQRLGCWTNEMLNRSTARRHGQRHLLLAGGRQRQQRIPRLAGSQELDVEAIAGQALRACGVRLLVVAAAAFVAGRGGTRSRIIELAGWRERWDRVGFDRGRLHGPTNVLPCWGRSWSLTEP